MVASERVSVRDAGDVLECELRVAAPAAIVFAAFTDPQLLVRWIGNRAEVAPRPGGIFRLDYGDGDVAHGAYLQVTPFSRVVFTWGWEGARQATPPGASTVEVTLTPDGDGTLLRLRHHGLSAVERVSHGEGWQFFLPRLATLAATALEPAAGD